MPVEVTEDEESEPRSGRPEREDVRFLPSGRVELRVGRRTYSLRRPLLGEFQDLRELLYDAQDEQRRGLMARLEAEIEGATEAEQAEATNDVPGQIAAIQRSMDRATETRKATAAAETVFLRWTRQAIEVLSGREIDEDDRELPLHLATLTFAQALMQHWSTVPLPSGAL